MIDTQKLSSWTRDVQGQYINEDAAYGAQCWDLAAHWSRYLGLPKISTGGAGRWPGWAGNMVDAFPQSPAIGAAYELHGPGEAAEPGDIAVWGDSYWYYPKTHVAVVIRDGGLLTCMSQNSTPSRADNPYPDWTTGPTTLQALPKQGLIGYIRPRTGLVAMGEVNQEDELSAADVERIINEITINMEAKHKVTRQAVNDARDSVNFNTQKQVEGVGRVTQQLIIDNATPDEFAAAVPAELVQAFLDALAKRLVK